MRSCSIGQKSNLISVLFLAIIFTAVSCAKKMTFLNSSVVPAARGTVQVKRDNNHNYVIKLQLSDLAEVSRLQPAKQMYVVWMVTEQQQTKNIGQIKSSTGRLSKRLKASFETVSSFKPEKILISAEDQADVQYPGSMVVLSTSSF